LEQFEGFETAEDLLVRRWELQRLNNQTTNKNIRHLTQEECKSKQMEDKKLGEINHHLCQKVSGLHCVVPVGSYQTSFIPNLERLVKLLEAIKRQRDILGLPLPDLSYRISGAILESDEEIDQICRNLEEMTSCIFPMKDSTIKFDYVWNMFWKMVEKMPKKVLFHNVLDILRNRILSEHFTSTQRKKYVNHMGRMGKCRDESKMLHFFVKQGFVEECKKFFNE
jgi:hypothetical protein